MNTNKLGTRLFCYFLGLFIMTIGIALSVKSNLGVSPVSSIPYTMTCVWGIEMGKATMLFHCILVLIQIILLRKNFKWMNLFQVPVGVIFGYFTTFCNWLAATYLPSTDYLPARITMMALSIVVIAVGIFFYMPASIMPLAGEGCMMAVSDITKIAFPRVKVGFDISMVVISLIVCLSILGTLGSVGAGTIVAAVFVGMVLDIFTKFFGRWRDHLMGYMPELDQ